MLETKEDVPAVKTIKPTHSGQYAQNDLSFSAMAKFNFLTCAVYQSNDTFHSFKDL